MGMRLFGLQSNTPNRLGSAASCSGNHQPCSVDTTRSSSVAFRRTTWRHLPIWFSIQAHSPSCSPYFAAVSGWMSKYGTGCSSREVVFAWRHSEWKNSKERLPVVSTSGYSSASSGVATGLVGGSS